MLPSCGIRVWCSTIYDQRDPFGMVGGGLVISAASSAWAGADPPGKSEIEESEKQKTHSALFSRGLVEIWIAEVAKAAP